MIILYPQYNDDLSSSTANTPSVGVCTSFSSSEDSDAGVHLQVAARQYDTSSDTDTNNLTHVTGPDHLSLENILSNLPLVCTTSVRFRQNTPNMGEKMLRLMQPLCIEIPPTPSPTPAQSLQFETLPK